MRNIISVLFCIVTLLGCKPNDGIILDKDTTYSIPAGYKVVQITENDVSRYRSLFSAEDQSSLILYKILSGSNHLIFIGVAYETSYEELKNEILALHEKNPSILGLVQNKSFTIGVNHDSLTSVTHHLEVLNSGNKYMFSVLNNKQFDDPTFVNQYILNHINTN